VDSLLTDRLLRASVESSVDAVICTDAQQRITFFNRGAEAMFGYRSEEVLGRPLGMLIPHRFEAAHREYVDRFGASGQEARLMGERREVAGLRKDGSEFPAAASIAQVSLDGERAYSVVLRDVTERRRFERDNAELVRELRAAVAARDEMLGIVSHDLRNPVNAVKMLAAAIVRAGETDRLPPVVAEHADVLLQAARQMDALIQDLLDVSKLESGRMPMAPRPVAMTDLVSAATRVLEPAAAEAGVRIQSDVSPSLPPVDVDPDRMVQVLSNLVSNSVKYTPRGGHVLVRAQVDEDVVRVTVEDTGVGIAEAELPRVFDRFWQSKRTNRSGAGLGLTIARGIVRAHGGRIWIESVLGEGTRVHFTVPRAARSADS
jgi:PAS domain S-box-containing protein